MLRGRFCSWEGMLKGKGDAEDVYELDAYERDGTICVYRWWECEMGEGDRNGESLFVKTLLLFFE